MEKRSLYRAVVRQYQADPLRSRSTQGRFHDETSGPTTYLADSPLTAWKEVRHRWRAQRHAYVMVEVSVRVAMVDLTDEAVQVAYGCNRKMLTGDQHEPCRRLAARLRTEGIEAFWTFSAAHNPEGRQLVVFLDQLSSESQVRVIDVQTVPRQGLGTSRS
jgi:RES domain-containing protein